MTEPPQDHDAPGGPPVERLGGDHPSASAADAALTLAGSQQQAMLATLTTTPAGYPFGSVVSFALDPDGNPLFVISTMAEHTRNAGSDPRASLLVTETVEPGRDPLDAGRVTLLGLLGKVPATAQEEATARVVAAIPTVGRYAHFGDFSCWRLTIEAVRWVGGFGAMSWIPLDAYRSATVDPVLPHRHGIITHMNDDHADACLKIARRGAARDELTSASMVGVDRFGADYLATTEGASYVRVRVPFPDQAADVNAVRMFLIAQSRGG